MALLHRLFSASVLALLTFAAAQIASAQCATVYSNIASDGAGNVHAWTILTDNYTNIGSGCAPPLWVTYGFHHTYSTSVTITSPSHRTVTTTGSGSQLGGSATGTVRTDASLPMASEHGTFTESGFDSITCSIAGAFFFGPFSLDFTPPPPQISGVRDNSSGSTTINVGTSGYLSIYGFALTAWGESQPPVISADDQSLTFYAANDNQVNVSYTVGNNARVGQHSVWVTTEAGTSNTGTYMVYDATPVVTGIAPNTFQAGNVYPGVVISGFHLGAACPTVTISGVGTSTFTPTLCSDSSVTGTVSIDPNAPTNVNGTVTFSSNGYGSGFQGAPGASGSASPLSIVVTPPPPPTISVYMSGTPIAANSTVYIDSTPALPLSAALVPGRPGVILTGNAAWQMNIDYIGPGAFDYGCTLSTTTAATGTWNIASTMGGGLCGGTAVVQATYQGYTATFRFTIMGQNPTVSAVKAALGTSPWFIQQLANSESPGYKQFQSDGQPVFGKPNGFGIMMLDYKNKTSQLWTWTINVQDGVAFNTSNSSIATSTWNTQLKSWQDYNATHSPSPVPMQANIMEGPCVFSYLPVGSQHPFSDAIWIKKYNGGGVYLQFVTDHWSINNLTNDGVNYVQRVCSTAP